MINDARAGIISCATLDNTPTQTGFFLKVFYCISASLSYSTMYYKFFKSRRHTRGTATRAARWDRSDCTVLLGVL